MNLPENYRDAVIAKLQELGIPPACPACGANSSTVLEHPVAMPVQNTPEELRIPFSTMPCACAICRNCGYVRMFSLVGLGVIPPFPNDEGESSDDNPRSQKPEEKVQATAKSGEPK